MGQAESCCSAFVLDPKDGCGRQPVLPTMQTLADHSHSDSDTDSQQEYLERSPSRVLTMKGRKPTISFHLQASEAREYVPHTVKCPANHEMRAKVAREMLGCIRCQTHACQQCEKDLHDHDAYYRCKACAIDYCLSCARTQLGLSIAAPRGQKPHLQLYAGDMLLCGPDFFDIHHVVLITGESTDVPKDVLRLLKPKPGIQLLQCSTVESSQAHAKLDDDAHHWYTTTSYLERDPHSETLCLIGDWQLHCDEIVVALKPVPVKILLSPLRPECEGETVDKAIFSECVEAGVRASQKYSWQTAVSAFIAYQKEIDQSKYADKESRERLLEHLQESWGKPPICSAVAIKTWQRYLLARYDEDPDEAVKRILRWMPLWCNTTTPSALVKTLTHCGWALADHLEGT